MHRLVAWTLGFGMMAFSCSDGGDDDIGGLDVSGGTSGSGNGGTIGNGGTVGTGGTLGTGGSIIPVGGTGGSAGSTGTSGSAGSSGTGNCGSNLTGRLRDFSTAHPDFEYEFGDDRGIVTDMLGADRKPVYAHGTTGTPTTTNETNFNQWFNDVDGVNEAQPLTLAFTAAGGGVYTYEDSSFFPIDDMMLGNEGNRHNYHFTFELNTTFVYNGGETFRFSGDDDVFAYINGRRVIDLGGVHTTEEDSVDLDAQAAELGLTIGGEYPLDFFFAERHTEESNFRIDTSIVFRNCGNGGEPT